MNPRSIAVLTKAHELGREWAVAADDPGLSVALIRDSMPFALNLLAVRYCNSHDRDTILYKGFPRGMRRQLIDELDGLWMANRQKKYSFSTVSPSHSLAGYSLTCLLLSLMSWEPASGEVRLDYRAYQILGDYAKPLMEQLTPFLARQLVPALYFMKNQPKPKAKPRP